MIEVGIKELKKNLSRYVAKMKKGNMITITEYGKPIGKLSKYKDVTDDMPEGLKEMIASGMVTPPKGKLNKNIGKLRKCPGKPLSQMIIEDRQ